MEKPEPKPNSDSQAYWDACGREELTYQFCAGCGKAQFYPRGRCIQCGNNALEWRISARLGAVYAVTQVYVGHPAFSADTPYPLALIELDEGFRLMTNVIGPESGNVTIGQRGHIVFETRGTFKLPQFVPER